MHLLILTHHKCGSNWFRRLFAQVAEAAGLNVAVARPLPLFQSVDRGAAHTIDLTTGGKLDVAGPLLEAGARAIHCVREPRDAFVSQYWSWKVSHTNNPPHLLEAREDLVTMSVRDGLTYLLSQDHFTYAQQLEPWRGSSWPQKTFIYYERLLEDFETEFGRAPAHLGIDLPPETITDIRNRCSFEKLTRRERGQEDVTHHLRKGSPGDWRNYFESDLSAAFDARYAWMYDFLGYEKPSL